MFSDVRTGTPMMELVSLERERRQRSGSTEPCWGTKRCLDYLQASEAGVSRT